MVLFLPMMVHSPLKPIWEGRAEMSQERVSSPAAGAENSSPQVRGLDLVHTGFIQVHTALCQTTTLRPEWCQFLGSLALMCFYESTFCSPSSQCLIRNV